MFHWGAGRTTNKYNRVFKTVFISSLSQPFRISVSVYVCNLRNTSVVHVYDIYKCMRGTCLKFFLLMGCTIKKVWRLLL